MRSILSGGNQVIPIRSHFCHSDFIKFRNIRTCKVGNTLFNMQCVANCNKLIGTRDGQSVCPFTQSRVCNIYTVIFQHFTKRLFTISTIADSFGKLLSDYISLFFYLCVIRRSSRSKWNDFCVFAVHKSTLSFRMF